jgi:hypothetical protein
VTPDQAEKLDALVELAVRNNELLNKVYWLIQVGLWAAALIVCLQLVTLLLKYRIYLRVMAMLVRIGQLLDQVLQLFTMTKGYAEDARKDRTDAARLVSDSGTLPKVAPPTSGED